MHLNKSTKSPEPSSPFARYEIEDRLKEVYNNTWTTRDAVRLREIFAGEAERKALIARDSRTNQPAARE